jgi:hypothetical protein
LLLAARDHWPGQVRALHVHHGLQAAGDDFERHCRQFCHALAVPLDVIQVQAHPVAGQSPQDAARRARYRALARSAAAQGCTMVLLGQHADDQAETVLLALGRGAGLPGLAAMPERFERDGMVFGRPLLLKTCDPYTVAFGLHKLGVDQRRLFVHDVVSLASERAAAMPHNVPRGPVALPPHEGALAIGSELETRINAKKIVPFYRAQNNFDRFYQLDHSFEHSLLDLEEHFSYGQYSTRKYQSPIP